MQHCSANFLKYRIYLLFILLLVSISLFSQSAGQYPVQVSTVVLPNPPMYLSAYSGVETDKLSVTLLNRDTQQSSLQVKLRMRIYCSQGQEISSRAESPYTPITLEGGIPLRLSMSDLAIYFRTENLRIAGSLPQGKLPVGHTRFCFEVLEYYTGRLLSSQGCGSAFIVLQTPPLLQQPTHASLLAEQPTGGILFRWSPQHTVGLERVQYEFILKEMFDTKQSAELGFAHGVEVYRTQTTATSLLYGMMQPPLTAGKRYVWQVRAFTDPISGAPLAFENNGQSRVFAFDIDYPCQAPQHIIATAQNDGIHLTWDASPHPSASYHLSYRRKDFSSTWHQASTKSTSYTISNLTPEANYEYKVGISCTNNASTIQYGTVAHIAYNPTDSNQKTKIKECGKSTQNNISNTEPKETLWAGDVIYAGDFTITLSTVQGSNGRFTGEGKVHVPYLSGIGMSVYFTDISINTDNQLIDGKIHTVYDESRGTIMNLDAFDHGGTTTPAQGLLVPTYQFDVDLTNVTRIHYDPLTNSLSFYDATGSRTGNYELTGSAPTFPVLVSDKEGNMYSINETNKDNPPANYTLVAVGKQTGELAGNAFDRNVVDSHKATVTFFDGGVGTYSFDEFLPQYDDINYIRYSSEHNNERLYPKLSAKYYVPWKFIPLNARDKVQAKISLAPNSELQPERVVFITASGMQVPASYTASNQTYQVSVTGTSNSGVHTLYALYPKGDGTSYFHLGQLRIDSRPPQHLKLVLVYAGGKYDKTAVANELNTIYNRVGIHWQVSEVQDFTYDKATIETLFDKRSGLLSAYNNRMTSLNQALQSHLGDSYQADACYVFMANKSQAGTGRDVVGFMPRGRQYGYIYTNGLNQSKIGSILAHELAHGKFKLYHTFDNIYAGKLAQGSTTNLMDYSGGTHLAKWQWNQLYDPAILNGVFDRDEDGEWVESLATKYLEFISKYPNGLYLALHGYTCGESFSVVNFKLNHPEFQNMQILDTRTIKTVNGGITAIAFTKEDHDNIYVEQGVITKEELANIIKGKISNIDDFLEFYTTQNGAIKALKRCNNWGGLRNDVCAFVNKESSDLYYAYIANVLEQITLCKPKNIIIFVNGYRGIIEENNPTKNTIKEFDNIDYWDGIDMLFRERRKSNYSLYANGHMSISTSNHINELGFFNSIRSSYCARFPIGEAGMVLENIVKHPVAKIVSYGIQEACSSDSAASCFRKPECVILNTTPNKSGFDARMYNGRVAGALFVDYLRKLGVAASDTLDVVCHSMGFAYAQGLLEEIKRSNLDISLGGYYIIAPENACEGIVNPAEWTEIWQYGTDEKNTLKWLQDGVAPQCPIGEIGGNRAYIPDEEPQGFVESHLIKNFKWIFEKLTKNEKGYVLPRK